MVVRLQIFKVKKCQKKNMVPMLCECLPILTLDFVIKAKKKYYPQTLLEEFKYEPKKIEMENLIDDDLEKSLYDKSDNDSDNDSDDESNE